MPSVICPAAQHLVAGMLMVDAALRLTMEDIAGSEWLILRDGVVIDIPDSTENVDSMLAPSTSTLEESFHVGESLDAQVLGQLKELGVPVDDKDRLSGEPRNPIAGAYWILLHRKLSVERNRQMVTLPPSFRQRQGGQVSQEQVRAVCSSQRPQRSLAKGQHTNSPHKSKICTIF